MIIPARAPFDFAATARFLRFTEAEAVDTFHAGRYRRLLHLGERLYLLTVEERRGSRARPSLAISLAPTEGKERVSATALAEAGRVVRRIFSPEHDLSKFRQSMADDPLLRELEAEQRGLRLARWPSLFETLVINILLQQIATRVAITLKRRVVERYGARAEISGETFYAFPQPEALARAEEGELRALGLSGAKAQSISALARASVEGALNAAELERADNESIIARLASLRGVGRWTAEWALVLHFGRTDVFPAGDLALRNAVANHYRDGLPQTEDEVRRFARERWGEWAAYVAIYFIAGARRERVNFQRPRVIIESGTALKGRRSRRQEENDKHAR